MTHCPSESPRDNEFGGPSAPLGTKQQVETLPADGPLFPPHEFTQEVCGSACSRHHGYPPVHGNLNKSNIHRLKIPPANWSIRLSGYGDSGGNSRSRRCSRCSCACRVWCLFTVMGNSVPCSQHLAHGFTVQAIVGFSALTAATCHRSERSTATTAAYRSRPRLHGLRHAINE